MVGGRAGWESSKGQNDREGMLLVHEPLVPPNVISYKHVKGPTMVCCSHLLAACMPLSEEAAVSNSGCACVVAI